MKSLKAQPEVNSTTEKPSFDQLPDTAFVRISALANHPTRPPAPVPLPFSEATLWRKVKSGEFPAPCKFGSKTTVWSVADVRAWMRAQQVA